MINNTNKNRQYIIDNKALMDEWDWENNNKLGFDPSKISLGSGKRPYWMCKNGHRWRTSVNHRAHGTQCPYCCGHLPIIGETDLSTTNPVLASEWHPTKNGDLTPSDVKAQSNIKVWWMCEKGHEYQAQINNRSNGTNCPICWNEMHTSFPEQAILFYLSKYFEVKNRENICEQEIDVYIPDIKFGVEYDGNYFHSNARAVVKELEKDTVLSENGIKLIHVKESNENKILDNTIYYIYNTKHSNLNWVILSILKIIGISSNEIDVENDRSKIYESYICLEKEQSLASKHPELAKEWNCNKNGKLTPEMIKPASNKIVWWTCDKNHEWQASVSHRASGDGCPYCSGHRVLPGYNDLKTEHPQIALEWNYDKNKDLLPTSVSSKSRRKVWWTCTLGHEWEAVVYSRVDGSGCPICAGKKVLAGFNDLETIRPDLVLEWNYEKNGDLLPSMFTKSSSKKVWWKCKTCGYEWEASIDHRNHGQGCPKCAKRKKTRCLIIGTYFLYLTNRINGVIITIQN